MSLKFNISRIVHGHWRLADWNLSAVNRLKLMEQVVDLGVSSFDHADIYGDYSCEALFGEALALKPELRNSIEVITKCGIKLISKNRPANKSHHYDYSFEHIIETVETSLRNFRTDYIDLLLLHRPAPFFNPHEVARAFEQLHEQGKVLFFGVSNFTPAQFDMLDNYYDLSTNQVEISPFCIEHFENGNMDFFVKEGIRPMAWSPLAGGQFANPTTTHHKSIRDSLQKVADELGVLNIETIMYAWLMKHPAEIAPIVGSGKIDRIKLAVDAQSVEMSLAHWYEIYKAAAGTPLP